MDFFAIDVETANADYSSICQIGIAAFENEKIVDSIKTYIDPEDFFDGMNVSINNITPEMVKGSPTFGQMYKVLSSRLNKNVIVHYSAFDRVAITRACEKYDCPELSFHWLDAARVVRRTWDEFAYKGYGLTNVAAKLSIQFQHHDALEDAIAAGRIFLAACKEKQLDIQGWTERIKKPIGIHTKNGNYAKPDKLAGNPIGEFFGETLVFTGSMVLPRREATKIAADAGFTVAPNVTKKTTYLVIGIQNIDRLKGYEKSSKQRKAEKLIKDGQNIQLMSEKDFQMLVNLPAAD